MDDTFKPQRLFSDHCPIDFIVDILLLNTTRQYRGSVDGFDIQEEKRREGKRGSGGGERLTHRSIYDYKNSHSLIFKNTLQL